MNRVWDWYAALANQFSNGYFGFDIAAQLWEQVQTNMINFVQQNGGTASYFTNHHKSARVKWQKRLLGF